MIVSLSFVLTTVERLVPGGLWELFQRVVPPAPVRPQGGGRRRHGDREVLAAILFVATTGCAWQQLPPVFGPPGPTAHRRFTEWSRARVRGKLHRLVLDELGARGELDADRSAPLDRRLRCQHPRQPGAGAAGARHTSRQLPARASSATAAKRHGGKGYDYGHLRRWLRSRNITPRIARKGIESSQRLGHHRWTVERTVAWLAGCRRLHRRYEREAAHFLAFAGIAATLFCYRRMGGLAPR
ncbi:Transposase DDE domain-containing protein [Streptomyces sp. 136MFCol5.1]|nr:Transposase DDE domain-containing protein [Streptomyces sp. 136MFCol5.1]